MSMAQSYPRKSAKSSSMSWTFVGFRRYGHARVITDPKNMADNYGGLSQRANTEGFRKGQNEDNNDCLKETPEKR